jgi:hypothetical protein
MLRDCGFDQERTVAKRWIRPVDRRSADVALGGWNLGIQALRACRSATTALATASALTCCGTGALPLSLLRVEADRRCGAHRYDG